VAYIHQALYELFARTPSAWRTDVRKVARCTG